MKISKNLAISDNGFIFNPTTGDSYSINAMGAYIIQLLKMGKTKKEIIHSIIKEYQTDESTADKDFMDFTMMLRSYNLLSNED